MINFIIEWWKKRKMKGDWSQGEFVPKHPEKCLNVRFGKKIIFRSSWERRLSCWMDENINVIEWGSEIIKIPYIYEVDQKLHTYYPDFFCKLKNKDGLVDTYIIEVKPAKEEKPPNKPRNKTRKAIKNYNYALLTYLKNQNKWKYAKRFCLGKNWTFKVLNENTLF